MTEFTKRLAITFFTSLFTTCPTLMTYAQQISSYEDFKLYCSREAQYYGVQSPDCDRYIQETRGANRPAFAQNTDSEAKKAPNRSSQMMNGLPQTMNGSSQMMGLPAGTKIKLGLADRLSSKTAQEGDEVEYFVKYDVLSPNGEVVIKQGAIATGRVTKARRAGLLGKKGKLEFTVEEVDAVNGTKIPLRSTIEKQGKGRGTAAVAVTALVSVLGVFIKGKNVTVEQGTIVDAYTDNDTWIEVRRP